MLRVTPSPSGAAAGFCGLSTCKSVWTCPNCSARIQAGRADELAVAMAQHTRSGGAIDFLTLTMRHNAGHSLEALWDALTYAWGRVTSGKRWVADRALYGVAGWFRAVEVTHGVNGWHVHVHVMIFVRAALSDGQRQALGQVMFGRWVAALERRGLTAWQNLGGLDIRPVDVADPGELARYFTKGTYSDDHRKAAAEAVQSAGKSGGARSRTPFDLLADIVYATEEGLGAKRADLALWSEWERVSKGRRQTGWSRGLRASLSLADPATEEALCAEQLDGDDVALIAPEGWRFLRRSYRDVCALLGTAEEHGPEAARRWLTDRGIPWTLPVLSARPQGDT